MWIVQKVDVFNLNDLLPNAAFRNWQKVGFLFDTWVIVETILLMGSFEFSRGGNGGLHETESPMAYPMT